MGQINLCASPEPVRDEPRTGKRNGAGKRRSFTGACLDCGARIWTSAFRCRVCCFRVRGPRWKGGYIHAGYKLVNVVPGGPHVREHIIVASRAVGRPLPAGAVVHHINGDRADNAPQNLVVFQSSNEHLEAHRKLRVLRAGGDPWNDRMCSCGPRPSSEFHLKPSGRWTSECRSCTARRNRAAYRAKGLMTTNQTEPVRDEQNRVIAPPQTVLPPRPVGVWDQNRDCR